MGKINIFIDNSGFINKGDELMLIATIEELQAKLNCRIIVSRKLYNQNILFCKKNSIFPLRSSANTLKSRINYLFKKFVKREIFITSSMIDVIVDIAGFQFGDQWEVVYKLVPMHSFIKHYNQFSNKSLKVLFLPQAFGPFTNKLSIERIKFIHELSDKIYARDNISKEHLDSLFPDSNKIKKYPDFTSLLHPIQQIQRKDSIVIIPNKMMVTQAILEQNEYFNFLSSIIELLIGKGEKIILLNHEGQGDAEFIQTLKKQYPSIDDSLLDLNALQIKDVIANSKMVISSRFHGVVSGLSQGVATFCTGWNHKYGELLKDYGVEDNYLDATNPRESIAKIERALSDIESYKPISDKIIEQQNKSKEMWNEIISIIKN